MEPSISVIVPMYDVANVIENCIRSLYAQTFSGFEIVFVNDCSTDDTVNVVRQVACGRNDIQVRILEQDRNRGVAAARNAALDAVQGEYVYWVDADDWIEPDTLQTMYDAATACGADIVQSEWVLSYEKNERHVNQPDASTGRELYASFAYGTSRWNLWLFLIRRSLIEAGHFRFTEGVNMGEDMMFMMKLCTMADCVAVIHRPLYHYIQTNQNALTKRFRESIPQVAANVAELETYVSGNCADYYVNLLPVLKLTLKLPLLISSDRKDYELWNSWFPESSNAYRNNPESPLRIRILEWAAVHRYFFILKIYDIFVTRFIYGVIYR